MNDFKTVFSGVIFAYKINELLFWFLFLFLANLIKFI